MKSLLRAGLALLVVSAPSIVSAAQTVAACCCPACPGCC
jgi:hypothetical protein